MELSIQPADKHVGLINWFQNSGDAIWYADKDLQLINYNNSFEKMMEMFYETSVMPGINVLQLLGTEPVSEWENYYGKAMAGEFLSVEMKLVRGLQEHYYNVTFNPVLMNDNVEGITVFAHDITSCKKEEQQLNYKIEELNTFMYKATHDLRSPLVSLMGLAHLAKEELQEDRPELRKYFDMIGKSVEKMDALLIDLVSITNVAQGKLIVNKIDFQKMSLDIIESLHHYPNFGNVTIRKIINDNVPFYNDNRLLYSVMQNLIDNAVKYSRSGNNLKPLLSIMIECTEQSAVINIIDNGIGIAEKQQEKVFDMFYRISGTNSSGTGLGLYIVKTAVERMGGKISLISREFEGTSIYITLPNCK